MLYHELFHAYMDFLAHQTHRLTLRCCRLPEVSRLVAMRRWLSRRWFNGTDETEGRYLTESESWEALNETWAVFIGWAIWNELEVQKKRQRVHA